MDYTTLRAYRDALLVLAYQRSMGAMEGARIAPIQQELGLNERDFMEVYNVLFNQGLLEMRGCAVGSIKLNGTGQYEAEQIDPKIALRKLAPPPMPAVNYGNINHGNQIIGGSHGIVQQGGAGATLNATGTWAPTDLLNVLTRVQATAGQLGLPEGQQAELQEHVADLKRHVQASPSRNGIVKAIGQAAASILTSGATEAAKTLGKDLVAALPNIGS